jgi:hypothetical protein
MGQGTLVMICRRERFANLRRAEPDSSQAASSTNDNGVVP